MTTIKKINNKYVVHFDYWECNNIEYNILETAKELCYMRLGNNILFIKNPFKDEYIIFNNIFKLFYKFINHFKLCKETKKNLKQFCGNSLQEI